MSERKVLKVDTPQDTDFNSPSLPPDMNNGDEFSVGNGQGDEPMPPMDGNEEGDFGGMSQDGGNQFDTNFDAGVEADEEEDPKRYIQQLTGKLSQSLRKYNQELPQPDADLNKYVAGMINKQAVEGISQEDVKEILSKIKDDDDSDNDDDNEDVPDDNNGGDDSMPPIPESYTREQKIDEVFNDIMNEPDNGMNSIKDREIKNISYRKKPFTSPNFD